MIYNINIQNTYDEIKNKFISLQPGDILNIESGIYNFSQQLNLYINGTYEKNIIIQTIDNKNAIFDFRTQQYGESGLKLHGEYVYFKNITIAYAGYKGIHSYLKNSTLENIEVYGSCDSGIQMCSGGNKLIRCVSHDNFGYKTIKNDIIKFGFNSDGFSDKLYEDIPNTYIECESYNNTDDGFDFYKRITNKPTKLINCKSHHNGKSVFDMTDYPRYEIDKEWFDQFKDGKEIKMCNGKNIIITLKNYQAFGCGDGYKLGGCHYHHNIELFNCESYNNKLYGYDQNHNSDNMTFYNCNANNNKIDFMFAAYDTGNAYFENCKSLNNNINIKCKKTKYINCTWL